MTLKEVKQLILYAQKRGIHSFRVGDVEVTFHDAVIFPHKQRASRKASAPETADKINIPAPEPAPTLQQINDYIYGGGEDQH